MKKTTRNYIWVLAANALLLAVVMLLWEARLRMDAPADEAVTASPSVPAPE